MTNGVYGVIPPDLWPVASAAAQLSPLMPGSSAIEDMCDGALDRLAVMAPPGVLDRCYVLAHGLRAVKPGGEFVAMAPKDRGGLRLAKELAAFGCALDEASRRHHRICRVVRPAAPVALAETIASGGPQIPPALGLWSQPGIFSWDRPDPGTALLTRRLPPVAGRGADFGCGVGIIGRAALRSGDVSQLSLIDIDRRAIAASGRNIADPRADFRWQDLRLADGLPRGLDFVVMNPPFHDGGAEDRTLGDAFIRAAAAALRPGGACWLVANRHLPYEQPLRAHFSTARLVEQADGYKVYEALR
jgi:16S rRNA (guanine1207-N2)-methyltransferase